jgi:protein TonB
MNCSRPPRHLQPGRRQIDPDQPARQLRALTPETGGESGMDGIEGGVVGGVPGGVVGGALGGTIAPSAAFRGPLRPGGGIQPPRKLKDVKPVYPQSGLTDQVRGTVIIEATIGVDGKVTSRVIRSVPSLDQAALDAVRQWAVSPSVRTCAAGDHDGRRQLAIQ